VRAGSSGRRPLWLLGLAVVCTLLAVAFYGPLAWLAGPVVVLPALALSRVSQRRRARRGLRTARRIARRAA
jgi:uncharacterized membrane protein